MLRKVCAYVCVVTVILAAITCIVRKNKSKLTVSIVGDIMLSRDVSDYLERFGFDYPYGEVANIFLNDDLTIGNLECPLTLTENAADKTKRFIFKAAPENAGALKKAGFDCFVLANNHTMDYLSQGLQDTMENLERNGLAYTGAVMEASLNGSYVFKKNGISVGILAYSALPPEGFFYNENKPTVLYINSMDFSKLEEDIASINCDFLMVYYHWGAEYLPYNSETQEIIAKKTIDLGADFVAGAHPHVLQNSVIYKSKYIYYSLGNFIFDKQIHPGTDKSIILQITIGKTGLEGISEIPIVIKDAKPST